MDIKSVVSMAGEPSTSSSSLSSSIFIAQQTGNATTGRVIARAEEHEEMSYVLQSRRKHLALHLRIAFAHLASNIHKKHTGRWLRVTEEAVEKGKDYVDDNYGHTTPPTPLGALATLPPELRRMIWAYLLPTAEIEVPRCSIVSTEASIFGPNVRPAEEGVLGVSSRDTPRLRKFAILRASSALREEVSSEMYRFPAVFLISARYPQWRMLEYPNGLPLRPFGDRDKAGIDLARFKSLQVHIYPPHPEDPGQFIRIRNQIIELAQLLKDQTVRRESLSDPELFKLHIRLPGVGGVHWSQGEQLQSSAEWDTKSLKHGTYDLVQVLLPFQLLHRVHNESSIRLAPSVAEFWARDELEGTGVPLMIQDAMDDVLDKMQSSVGIGQGVYKDEFPTYTDHDLEIRDKYTSLILDVILDYLPGPTAARLRFERFRKGIEHQHFWMRNKDGKALFDVEDEYYWEEHVQLYYQYQMLLMSPLGDGRSQRLWEEIVDGHVPRFGSRQWHSIRRELMEKARRIEEQRQLSEEYAAKMDLS